jgi:magnesium chelatase family protein
MLSRSVSMLTPGESMPPDRAHDKVLRVSRTIADLAGSADITPTHLSEAVNYRMLDRQLWT